MKDRSELDVSRQVRFGKEGMEADEEVDTDLTDWGIVEGGQERETRIEEEAATEFGIDDRSEVVQKQQTEQEKLVVERDQDQMTLGGEVGGMEAKFGD